MNMFYKAVVILSVQACILSLSHMSFSQDEPVTTVTDQGAAAAKEAEVDDIVDLMSKSFKKALNEIDMRKAAEKSALEEKLIENLDIYMRGWITLQSDARRKKVNAIIDQDWHALPETPPQRLDYYLRDFSYKLGNNNITETDSIVYPYQAEVDALETLYVEQAPLLAEPRSDYQFTVMTDIKLGLQYNKGSHEWGITDLYVVNIAINKGWPSAVKRKLRQYFIPTE